MMITPTNNFARFGLALGLFFSFLFLSIFKVSALSVSDTSVGYGYTQEYNGVVSSRTWVAYSSNNLVKYNYDLPHSSEIDIDTFNFRFHITGNFLRGNNYILTFSWFNDSSDGFSLYYSRMIHSMLCYSNSWSSSSQSANNCFSNYNISYSNTSNNDILNITLSFTPINDIYGIAFINEHDDDPYSSFPSEGWEITNINYQIVSSGTSEIIDNATQNTDNIINNQNSNTQDIIDNQNQNTQQQIESQKVCEDKNIGKDNTNTSNGYLMSDGTVNLLDNWFYTTDYINIKNAQNIKLSNTRGANPSYCFYDNSKSLIECFKYNSQSNINITINNNNVVYIRFSIYYPSSDYSYKTYLSFQVCKNGNQAITDSITDSTPPNTSELSNATGWLPPGPVDSILNLPLTLLQSLNNAFSNNSCQPLNVNLPYVNTLLTIPCMSSVWEGFGLLPLFTWIGRVLGGVLLYKYLIGLYKWVDDTLTMRENNNFDDGSLG